MTRFIRTLIWRWKLSRLIPRLGTVTLDRQVPDYSAFLRGMKDNDDAA